MSPSIRLLLPALSLWSCTPSSSLPGADTAGSSTTGDSGQPEDSAPPQDTAPPADTGDSGAPSEPSWLSETDLYVNIGDSLAAGYDAEDEYGYARLLQANLDDWPSYKGHDLQTVAGADTVHIVDSGATSDEVLENLQRFQLPPVSGEALATISAGGNDFNDSVWTMLSEDLTRQAAAEVRANLAEMIELLRGEYDDLHVYVLNIQDPTDGLGTVPDGYDEGACEAIAQYGEWVGETVVANLAIMNEEIAAEAAAQGAELADYHGWFLGHGLNSGDGWMSDDCAHPTSQGHHEIRRLIWSQWSGQLY